MSFESWSEFLAMGGHARYVWLSYGLAVLVLTGNLVLPWLTLRRRLRQGRMQVGGGRERQRADVPRHTLTEH